MLYYYYVYTVYYMCIQNTKHQPKLVEHEKHREIIRRHSRKLVSSVDVNNLVSLAIHSVKNCGNLHYHIFHKNYVKTRFFLVYDTVRCFSRNFLQGRVNFSFFHIVLLVPSPSLRVRSHHHHSSLIAAIIC